MSEISDAVEAAQEIATELSPAPVTFERISSAKDVKARLDWGEPALTIIDLRDRESYNDERIQGALSFSPPNIVEQLKKTTAFSRDLYLYGDAEQDVINTASQLDMAGFQKVAILENGLTGWKAIGGPTEGRKT